MFYKARNEAIKFHDDYSSRMSETELKATKGTGLKILISKITNSSCTSKSR